MTSWAERILSFQKELLLEVKLPRGVGVLNPYQDEKAFALCKKFYSRFYNDSRPRRMILGINPGRLGGGITGIPFTDPVNLAALDIANDFPKKHELSSEFIYLMIDAYGGPSRFYSDYYFSSVSPLGFIKDKKNLNYYDVQSLPECLTPFIVKNLQYQISWGIDTTVCFCLGEGENFKFLKKLNEQYHFFQTLIPLPHPRFIMQYRRKQLDRFVARYCDKLKN
jgi:hypothetical protein